MDMTAMLGVDWDLNPVRIDPPMHTVYRKLLTPFFTPKAVSHMEKGVRQTCDELIARFADKGGCDFVRDFSIPFPSIIFLRLMGLPLDMMEQFFAWEQDLLRGESFEARAVAAREILVCLEEHLDRQRRKPATPLMENILTARIEDGRPLNEGEVLGMFYTFYVGGLDTVYGTISWSMRHIATHPEFQQFLRDNPGRLNKAVDELIRMFAVVSTQRRVRRDMVWNGVEMKENDLVVMPIFIACRDPAAYPNPHEIDLDRYEPMLSFASGPHLCLGMHLARSEIRIAIESFLERFADIHIPPGVTVRPSAGGVQVPSFTIRGRNSFGVVPGSDKQVSIYLDGVYISSPRGSIFDLPDIARLEVLRGPQGTLFGRNATAGAISVVTRDPGGEARANATATIGNLGQYRLGASIDLPQVGPFSAYLSFLRNYKRGDIRNAAAGTLWDRTLSPDPRHSRVRKSPRRLGNIDADSYFAALKFEPSDSFNMVYKFDRNDDSGTPEGVAFTGYNPAFPALGPSAPLVAPSSTHFTITRRSTSTARGRARRWSATATPSRATSASSATA